MTRYMSSIGVPVLAQAEQQAIPERITLRLPPELARKVDAMAEAKRVTRSDVIRSALELAFAMSEQEEP